MSRIKPEWFERELTYKSLPVKTLGRLKYKNQKLVLDCFQEEDWPERIWNPFDSLTKMIAAVRDLNKENKIIRFIVYRKTEEVGWEIDYLEVLKLENPPPPNPSSR